MIVRSFQGDHELVTRVSGSIMWLRAKWFRSGNKFDSCSNSMLLFSSTLLVAFKSELIMIAMTLLCLDALVCCELVSTFKVLTWRVMPVCMPCHDCRSCHDCLLVKDPEFAS